jgi:D-3-phosphoglycerate dehydrogenase
MTTPPYRVLVADAISADGLAPLRDDGRFELVVRPGLAEDALAAAMADVDAVLVRSATKITRASLAQAARLKVIGRAGVGVDTIDVDAATERGIAVLTAPGGNTIAAAELTFALLLSLVRRVPAADQSMRGGAWDRKSFTGTELFGKTLGLVGAGRIGGEVAKRARVFGMKLLCYDPYLTEARAAALELEIAPLDDLLARSDIVSLHVPLTEATEGLIQARQIGLMKRTAYLVNAARGGVVNQAALVQALQSRAIAGAALDVFDEEPLPADHPLRTLTNVVLTPHLGASTVEAQQNVALEIAHAVRAALTDGDLSSAVNAPAVGSDDQRRLRPLLALAERLGRLVAAQTDGPLHHVEIHYAGASPEAALRPLAAMALVGLLTPIVGDSRVNLVNAPRIAEARGMQVQRVRSDRRRDYAEYLEVHGGGNGGAGRAGRPGSPIVVGGALLSEGGHPRVVRIGEHRVDVVPQGTILLLRNKDVPGVIGRVGTALGSAGVNIAGYHQSRIEAGGDALAAVSVDHRLDAGLLARLRELPDVRDVRQVVLD